MNYNLIENGTDIIRIDISFGHIKTLPILPLKLEELCADNNFDLEELPALPSTLRILSICLTGVKDLQWLPETLEELYISENPDIHIGTLPSRLEILFADSCELEMLPHLPSGLKMLSVDANYLVELEGLPDSLETLVASNNEIIRISTIPTNLRVALIHNNVIKRLPELPAGLIELNVSENNLRRLPMLPASLFNFVYFGNPLIYEFHHKRMRPRDYVNGVNRFVQMMAVWRLQRWTIANVYRNLLSLASPTYSIASSTSNLSMASLDRWTLADAHQEDEFIFV
jgi:Leucine-rich repeat (LRR) protein